MSSQVMRPEMDPHHGAGLSDHDPGGSIGDGEYPLVSRNASGLEIIFQSVGQLLGDEDYLHVFPAFGIPDSKLLIIHIHGGELQDLAHPHATPGHEFQHETVSHLGCSEDDLVDHFFFMDLPRSQLSRSEKLLQHRGITGILELTIQVVADKVKEGLEIGVAGVLGELLTGIVEAG